MIEQKVAFFQQLAKTKEIHSKKNFTSNIKTVFVVVLTVKQSHCPICDSFDQTLYWTQPIIHNIHRTGADGLFLT